MDPAARWSRVPRALSLLSRSLSFQARYVPSHPSSTSPRKSHPTWARLQSQATKATGSRSASRCGTPVNLLRAMVSGHCSEVSERARRAPWPCPEGISQATASVAVADTDRRIRSSPLRRIELRQHAGHLIEQVIPGARRHAIARSVRDDLDCVVEVKRDPAAAPNPIRRVAR